jgi:hypothetical protein
MLQHLAHYSEKMEQTMIEFSKFKLKCNWYVQSQKIKTIK